PRVSATLVDGALRESLAKLGLDLREVLRLRGKLDTPDEPVPELPVAAKLRAVARRAAGELGALREVVGAHDRGLSLHVRREADQIEDRVGKLAAKLERVQANAAGSDKRHQRRIANGLCPNGEPQERVRGALEFVARYGTGWIEELLAAID